MSLNLTCVTILQLNIGDINIQGTYVTAYNSTTNNIVFYFFLWFENRVQ